MIDPKIRKFLGLPEDKPTDYLFIVIEENAINDTQIFDWINSNYVQGCLVMYQSGKYILQMTNGGRGTLTRVMFDRLMDDYAAVFAGIVCVACQITTAQLDSLVPVDYGSPYQVEGTTIRDLFVYSEGTEGNSLIYCAEKPTPDGNGTDLQQEEIIRFTDNFLSYYVFSDEQIAQWKENNIIGPGD